MAADSTNDQELALKKRARRRLVGAIALVLLMVIVLPMVLRDRSALAPQEAIKITMPEDVVKQESNLVATNQPAPAELKPEAVVEPPVVAETPVVEPIVETPEENSAQQVEAPTIKPESKPAEVKVKEKQEPKKEDKPVAVKPVEQKTTDEKPKATGSGSFTIQVGVFSDPENVKQLQAKLKQVGLASRTEKITTPKGEKIRLKAGTFPSRQEAAYALTKIQAADLTGMVISN